MLNSVNFRSEMDELDKEKVYLKAIGDLKERSLSVRKAAKKWKREYLSRNDRPEIGQPVRN